MIKSIIKPYKLHWNWSPLPKLSPYNTQRIISLFLNTYTNIEDIQWKKFVICHFFSIISDLKQPSRSPATADDMRLLEAVQEFEVESGNVIWKIKI